MAILAAHAASRRYTTPGGSVVAVDRIDLRVWPGELVVLTGPSGSGKTTLLHLLAGLTRADSGRVTIEGRALSELSRGERTELRLRRVGLVFSEHNLSPALSAAENVDLPLALLGLPRVERRERVATALRWLGVSHLAQRLPEALSSGEQQRVAVARAIATEPAALVADEPTAHLDSEAAAALLATLARLVAERGMAAVVATHDAQLVAAATRVLRLKDGRLSGNNADDPNPDPPADPRKRT